MTIGDFFGWTAVVTFGLIFMILALQMLEPYPRFLWRLLCRFGWHLISRRDVEAMPGELHEDDYRTGIDSCACGTKRNYWLSG